MTTTTTMTVQEPFRPARWRRRAFVLGAGVPAGAAALASACGVSQGAQRIQERKTARQVTVRWEPWGTTTMPQVAAPQAFKIFQERYPNVKMELWSRPRAPGVDAVVEQAAAFLADSGPDVPQHCCQNGYVLARQGFLLDVDPLIKRDVPDAIRRDWVPWLIDLFHTKDLGQFALPMYSGVDAVYYNKTAFKKAGIPFPDESWDWEKYGEIATKLTDPANQQWGRRLIASYDRTLQRIHQAGGHYVDPKDNRRCIVDQPEALRALQYEFDAGWKHQHAAKEDAPGFPPLAGMNDTQIMASGRVVMSEEGSWRLVTYMNDLSPHVDWDVAPMPKGPVQRDALATNDGWSIWKGSKVPDEAWEWMKFLQGDEWMEINTRATGQQTARKSFQDKWVKLLKEANPGLAEKNLKPFTDAIQQNYARPIELFEKHAEAATIMNKAQNDSIRDGKTTVEAAYREAARQINALHAR